MRTNIFTRSTIFGRTFRLATAALLSVSMLAACGDDDDGDPDDTVAANITIVSGGTQSGAVNSVGAPLVVKVTNAAGDPLSGKTVTFATTTGAILGSASATTNSSGVAQTTFTNRATVGVQTVTASVSGVTTPATFTLTATGAAAASQVVVISGNNQTGVGSGALASPFVVAVRDAAGNPVVGATVNWTTTSGVLSGATSTTDANGQASITFTNAALAGNSTITATVNGTAINTTFTATSTGVIPTAIVVVSGNNQTGPINAAMALPLVVRVNNASGAAIPGITVTFAVTAGGGSVTPLTVVTNASGTAQATLTSGATAGVQTVTASAAGVAVPVTFTATSSTVGAPTAIVVTSGNNQTANRATQLPLPLTVTVRDAGGNPVVGAVVNWTTTAGTLAAATSVTNASGVATITFTNPNAAATITVTATINGTATNVTFTITST